MACWQAKITTNAILVILTTAGASDPTGSGVGDQFQADQHEMHEVLPIIKEHVA
jgi:hypothetical protein